jgi:hypothetical protein
LGLARRYRCRAAAVFGTQEQKAGGIRRLRRNKPS